MKRRVRRKSNWFLFLLLNIIVSAATTLTVLTLWDRSEKNAIPSMPLIDPVAATLPADTPAATEVDPSALDTPEPAQQAPGDTAVASGQRIEISAVVGATDPRLEYVLLRRVGEDNLDLTGWSVSDESDNTYTFPSLELYPEAEVQLYTRAGADTPTQLFWNRTEPLWTPGEWVTLRDAQGNEHARYQIP